MAETISTSPLPTAFNVHTLTSKIINHRNFSGKDEGIVVLVRGIVSIVLNFALCPG